MVRIAIFASGAGSNALKIIEHFCSGKSKEIAEVSLIVCNRPGAAVLQIAEAAGIPTLLIDKERFFRGDGYVDILKEKNIRLIVLAGFLWKIPDNLLQAYPRAIINIHPALLPKYGGKGMYGHFVHQSVIDHQEPESGITIHYVDGHYDNGDIIFQARCPVKTNDTPDSLAKRVQKLEHQHFPKEIERLAINLEAAT